MQGINLIVQDEWIGIYLIFFNIMFIMNSIAYYRWFKEDCYETRQQIRRTYLYILIQTYLLYIGLFIIVYNIPASTLPDEYEDSFGNKYEFPPEKKEDMKMFALYFIVIVAIFTIWI